MTALDGALRYAAAEGIRSIWIPRGSKAPVAKDWPNLATTDPNVIRQWAAENPGCNFGLVMGDGFVAIDIDDPSRYPELKALGFDLPPTRMHKTASGLHLIYRVPLGATIRNAVKKFGIVDVRHANAQVVCPGSVHPSGAVYEIAEDLPIADLPRESLAMLAASEPVQRPSPERGKIPEGRRNSALASLAGSMRRRGMSEAAILAALLEENSRCEPPLEECEVETIARSVAKYPPDDALQAALSDERPKVLLPGDDRLMSDTASELGAHLGNQLYLHNGEVATIENGLVRPVSAQAFRTAVERTVVCYRRRSARKVSFDVDVTMSVEDARGIMASEQFTSQLRPLSRVNRCRLPVLRSDGRIELLPEGYDAQSHALTISDVVYDEGLSFEVAVNVIRDLFGEFIFADGERSMAVAVSALLGLYGAQVLPSNELRPSFIVTKNDAGSGATTLVQCVVVPVLGRMATGVKPEDDNEMRKAITTAVREGCQVIFLDNIRGRIASTALEAFISSPHWTDRLLGANERISGPNIATVFCTANNATVGPDMRRRSLFVELHLDVERAEDRIFKRPLSEQVLQSIRPQILAACWALVRHWDEQGRPKPSRSHSAFDAWAGVVGGMVEAAGFACPLETAEVSITADEDGAAMRALTLKMVPGTKYTVQQLSQLCREHGLFAQLVADSYEAMQPKHRSGFGWLLSKYKDRQIGDLRFIIDGEYHKKRFRVAKVGGDQQGQQGLQGFSPRAAKNKKNSLKEKNLANLANLAGREHEKGRKWKFASHSPAQLSTGESTARQ